jgi:TPR repeat protein
MALAAMYGNGWGVKKDLVAACGWVQKASDQGNDASTLKLAEMYYMGEGVSKDVAHALTLERAAAEHRYPPAEFVLGKYYENGIAIGKDMEQAHLWERRAADAGYGSARVSLAIQHLKGNYADIDDSQAAFWLDNCDGQDAECLNDSAWFYATTAQVKLRDPKKAEEFALKAVALGPGQPPYIDTLAAAYAAEGRYSEAAEQQQKAMSLYPPDPQYDKARASMGKRLAFYQSGQAYVDDASAEAQSASP